MPRADMRKRRVYQRLYMRVYRATKKAELARELEAKEKARQILAKADVYQGGLVQLKT